MKIAVAGATGRVGRYVVEVLESQGHEVVRISRSNGVDVATGEGLDRALAGVEAVEWARKIPNPDDRDVEVEIRPLFEAQDAAELPAEVREKEQRLRGQLDRK